MPDETPVKTMTLIYIKEKYTNKIRPLTLIEDEATADAVTSLAQAAGLGEVIIIDVPLWPEMKPEAE